MIEKPAHNRILFICKDEEEFAHYIEELEKIGFFVYLYTNPLEAIGQIYNDPPHIILLAAELDNWEKFINAIKEDPVFRHIPIIVIIPSTQTEHLLSLSTYPFDDWIFSNAHSDELVMRVKMKEVHSSRYLDANPLTRLPGNFTIIASIQKSIDESWKFALGYVDIDNFKAFNDKYGFARGDDLIKMTARILTNVVRNLCPEKGFVGHIGGDDFVFIIDAEQLDECCKQIIQNFDLVSTTVSNDKDRIRGYIECEDRQGKMRKFPLPTISLAMIDTRITSIKHPGEASSIAGELKKEVKKKSGSNYFVNRRES